MGFIWGRAIWEEIVTHAGLQPIHFIVTIQDTGTYGSFWFSGDSSEISERRGEELTWEEVVHTSVTPAAGRQRKEGHEIEAILNYTAPQSKPLFRLKKKKVN